MQTRMPSETPSETGSDPVSIPVMPSSSPLVVTCWWRPCVIERQIGAVFCRACLVSFCSLLLCVTTLLAQTSGYESGLLIERLRQQSDIAQLQSLANDTQDKIVGQYAAICAQLLEARSKSDPNRIAQIQQQFRALPTDHVLSPLWAMLEAEIQYFDLWANRPIDPALIVRLGYPTSAQQKRVAQIVGLLHRSLTLAQQKLASFPVGVREVLEQRCSLLLGLTAYLDALGQPEANRYASLQEAHRVLEPLVNARRDDWQMRSRAKWLDAQILLALGQTAAAVKIAPGDPVDQVTRVIEARLLAAEHRIDVADHLLARLEGESADSSASLRLIIADNIHRLWTEQGDPAKAFGMYLRLLAQPITPVLYDAIGRRWLNNKVIQPSLKALPDTVLFAMAKQLHTLARQHDDANQDFLTAALSSLMVLRNRQSVMAGPLADQVQLLWAVIKPMYEPDDPQKAIESMSMLTYLAENAKDNNVVYPALTAGMSLCEKLLKLQDRDMRARALRAYQPLARVLFDRFGTSELADNSRLFDVVAVRLPAGEYALAMQRLGDLPVTHWQYWLAQRYLLGIYRKLTGSADWPAARIAAAVIPIRDMAMSQLDTAATSHRQMIAQVALEASGMLWQLAASEKNWKQAADQLVWLKHDQTLSPTTRRTWLCRRLLSLQRAEQWPVASELGLQLLAEDGQATFAVVMQVLEAMDQKLDDQRHAVMAGKLSAVDQKLLDATNTLAQQAVSFAVVHVADEKQVLAVKLIWARGLCDAGKMRDALALLGPLTEQFDAEPALWLAVAQCHLKLALPANYQQAAMVYRKLITRSIPDAQGRFPSWYWLSWARYLRICDLTNQYTDIILARVDALKAEDPTLGGEPYATMLGTLAAKYSSQ